MRFLLLLAFALGCTTNPSTDPRPGPAGGKGDDPTTPVPSVSSVQHFLRTPLVRQGTEYTCGVAALLSVLAYYGVPDITEDELATQLGSDPDSGTSYREIVAHARGLGLTVTTQTDMSLAQLADHIDHQRPLILALQAWADDPATTDWSETYEYGHYVVATGYDADNFYFMDPYMRGSYAFIPRAQLEQRWHDGDVDGALEHFAIIISGRQPTYDPEQIVPLP